VHGVGIVRDPDAMPGQLLPESYRPRARSHRRTGPRCDPLAKLRRGADQRLPDPLPGVGVERREGLAAAGVEDSQPLALCTALGQPAAESVEAADAARREAQAGRQPTRRGDADPQAGEGAGTEADGDPVDLLPAAGCGGCPLDLGQQRRRVAGPSRRRQAQQRLVQGLAVAPGAGGGVDGRGVEADDDQRGFRSSP
jgi:hypothetical protein